jgi:hypothetical protein
MRSYSQSVWVIGIAAFLVGASAAVTAEARTCTTDAGCPHGFQCSGGSCVSLTCESDSDCAPGLPCYQDIQCVAGPDASSVPGGACVPQWQAPCNVDSDCGDGFQCVSSRGACDCSGSAANVPPRPAP